MKCHKALETELPTTLVHAWSHNRHSNIPGEVWLGIEGGTPPTRSDRATATQLIQLQPSRAVLAPRIIGTAQPSSLAYRACRNVLASQHTRGVGVGANVSSSRR